MIFSEKYLDRAVSKNGKCIGKIIGVYRDTRDITPTAIVINNKGATEEHSLYNIIYEDMVTPNNTQW